MTRLVVKNKLSKESCYSEIGLAAHNIANIVDASINTNQEGLCDHS